MSSRKADFAVSVVSQYMHDPYEEHIYAVYRNLKHHKGSLGKGPFFENSKIGVEGYLCYCTLI